MKILLIGAHGTIGQAILSELSPRHDIITAGRNSGEVRVDLKDFASVQAMYAQVGAVDAVIAAAGNLHFGALADMTPELMGVGIADKLMGQVNLVLAGQHVLNDGGSFTLISGIVSHEPIEFGSSAGLVNAGLEGFTRNAAVELSRGLRINVICPTVLTESLPIYGAAFRGFVSVDAAKVALAFSKSVEGKQTGQIYHVQ